MMTRLLHRLVIVAMLLSAAPSFAADTGLPIPRFVSLRSDEVNLRTGPGVRYPVDWVYSRADLPVEVVAEFESWRKIRDWQGSEGWVHQSMLSGRRSLLVTGGTRKLLRTPEEQGAVIATVEAGVTGRLLKCPSGSAYCKVSFNRVEGWLKRDEFWGVYKAEVLE